MASSSGGAKRPAASKGTGNKNTKNSRPKSGAAPKSAGGRGKNAPRPIRREVGAGGLRLFWAYSQPSATSMSTHCS